MNGALQDFHAALEVDANFARAYAGLAETHITLANHGSADVLCKLQAAETHSAQAIARRSDPKLFFENESGSTIR